MIGGTLQVQKWDVGELTVENEKGFLSRDVGASFTTFHRTDFEIITVKHTLKIINQSQKWGSVHFGDVVYSRRGQIVH